LLVFHRPPFTVVLGRTSEGDAMSSEQVPVISPSRRGPSRAPVRGALRAVETFLLSGGQRTARRNAWAAVVADRQRARDRREAEHEIAALTGAGRGGAAQPR
jgi:hypothetical protein